MKRIISKIAMIEIKIIGNLIFKKPKKQIMKTGKDQLYENDEKKFTLFLIKKFVAISKNLNQSHVNKPYVE